MAKALIGFFRTREEGERAYSALLSANYTQQEVGYVAGDTRAKDIPAIGPRVETGSQSEAGSKAFIGGVAGFAAGMIAAAIPGIGLMVAGPFAAAVSGMAAGAAAGGLIGLLQDQGISDEEAEFYAEGVRRGGAVVSVHGVSDDRADNAQKILKDHGALDVEKVSAEWRNEGWRPSRTPTGPLGTERR